MSSAQLATLIEIENIVKSGMDEMIGFIEELETRFSEKFKNESYNFDHSSTFYLDNVCTADDLPELKQMAETLRKKSKKDDNFKDDFRQSIEGILEAVNLRNAIKELDKKQ